MIYKLEGFHSLNFTFWFFDAPEITGPLTKSKPKLHSFQFCQSLCPIFEEIAE